MIVLKLESIVFLRYTLCFEDAGQRLGIQSQSSPKHPVQNMGYPLGEIQDAKSIATLLMVTCLFDGM